MLQSIEQLEEFSTIALFSAVAVYSIAFVFYAVDLANRSGEAAVAAPNRGRGSATQRSRALRIGFSLTVLGFIFHLAATVLRGLAAERLPFANMYEFALTATVAVVGIYLLAQFFVDLRFLGALITGLTVLFLTLTKINFYVAVVPLPPALDSYWLIIHILVAVLSVGFFTLSFGLSILQLLQTRRNNLLKANAADARVARATVTEANVASVSAADAKVAEAVAAPAVAERVAGSAVTEPAAGSTAVKQTATELGAPTGAKARGSESAQTMRFMSTFPSDTRLEDLSYRMAIIGFVFWTFTLIAGSIWAEAAWSRYWGWDTKEVWTFVIWVLYAGFIHARATRGWRGTRSAWLSIVAYTAVIFNFTIVNVFFKGLHAYSGL